MVDKTLKTKHSKKGDSLLGSIKNLCGKILPSKKSAANDIMVDTKVYTSNTYEKALAFAQSHENFTLEEIEIDTQCSRQSLKNQLSFLVKAGELESVMRCVLCGYIFRDGEDICPTCRKRKRAHAYRLKVKREY
ncbi:MAG: hypothetical protein QF415_10075 [Candidatus Undinarchaeales archaeon]|nr:hypothetical protein [Candidatus Undinarchaeales archaeon]MDP7494512.1 hypothetical protein [Candidatus Undinarchaeales archaeon]